MSQVPTNSVVLGNRLLRIDSRRRWFPDLGAVFRSRQLLFLLCRRNITVLYRQTVMGSIWLVVAPVISAGLLSFVFGRVAHLSSGGVPYFAFTFAGLLAWNLFSSSVTGAAGSLVSNSTLFTRIYFPRLLLPLSALAPNVVNTGISCAVMFFLLVAYKIGFYVSTAATASLVGAGPPGFPRSESDAVLDGRVASRRPVRHTSRGTSSVVRHPRRLLRCRCSAWASDDLSPQPDGNHRGGLSMVIARTDSPALRFDMGCCIHHRHNIRITDRGIGRLRTPRVEVCRCRLTRRFASVTYRRCTPWG